MSMRDDDVRLSPIATPAETARLIEMPANTLRLWMKPAARRGPLVHTDDTVSRGQLSVSVLGFAEAHTSRGLRDVAHWSMPKVVAFAHFLRKESGNRYALATPRLVTDGVDVFAEHDEELHRVIDGQLPFRSIIEPYLTDLALVAWPDGQTGSFRPPRLQSDLAEIDPRFNGGRLSFTRTRVPLFAIAGALRSGQTADEVSGDYDVNVDELALVEANLEYLTEVA